MVCTFLLSQPVLADETQAVKETASEIINRVIDYLRDTSLEKEVRDEKIIATILPIFDFNQMAKLSLGKKNWAHMNEEQRDEFVTLFVGRLQESYLEKLDLYGDEEVVMGTAELVKKRIHVTSRLVSKDDDIEMNYKFYKSKTNGWLVYDIEIMGVSVVQTYRSQFAGMLTEQSVEDLLTKLREHRGAPTRKS